MCDIASKCDHVTEKLEEEERIVIELEVDQVLENGFMLQAEFT